MLFSSIGENFLIRIIWALVGVAAVFFQTVKLREYFNTKKSIRFVHLSFYIICTVGSVAGTLGAGYSHIEKTKLNNIDKTAQIEIINKKIYDIENKSIDNTELAINNVMATTNLNQWALLGLIKQKKEINATIEKKYSNLANLKNEKARLLKKQAGVISSLAGLSGLLGVSEEMTAFVFLIFVSVILELMVYGSATFTGKLIYIKKSGDKKNKPKKKNKEKGQLFFVA
jgi:hypothetical protein